MAFVSYTAATLRQFASEWKLFPPPTNLNSFKLGKYGEQVVANIYQSQDWQVLARNFRGRGYELDIVAYRGKTLVAIEVKTRSAKLTCTEALIGRSKSAALKRGLETFLHQNHELTIDTLRIDLAICLLQQPIWPDVNIYCGI